MKNTHLQSNIRKKILQMVLNSKEGHIASSFSIVEIMVSIYRYLENKNLSDKLTSNLILSKGHAVYSLYGLMNELGLLSDEDLSTVCQYGSYLIGHVPVKPEKNFHVGTGSLGQGFPMALGKAYASSLKNDMTPYFVIVGDGELNEGSCWESIMLLSKFPQLKTRIFIDNNNSSTRAIPMQNAFNALKSAWNAVEVDGHDIEQITKTLLDNESANNLIIICNTHKGFPLKDMIGNPIWHHKMPNHIEVENFNKEIENYFGDK